MPTEKEVPAPKSTPSNLTEIYEADKIMKEEDYLPSLQLHLTSAANLVAVGCSNRTMKPNTQTGFGMDKTD